MIDCLVKKHPLVILKYFNTILDENCAIPEWCKAMITPIFKKGSKENPSNYRGISLLSCIGKLFMTLLNNRLMNFVEKEGILSKNQMGFIPGNRTSDAHIILHNLIQKHCHKNNSKIYSCFIDFSKAFNTIPRNHLLQKLLNYNIKGNFFNTIRNIYANDMACVKVENKLTEQFKINQGVRQGCVLSPTLFNIYMSDLTTHLNAAQGKLRIGTDDISCLIWADDIVLLSESEEGLKEMLKIMEKFCNENKLIINTDKTKCMIFNKTGRLVRKQFTLNNLQLEVVRSYKYLGFLITPSGEINSGLKDLRDRAMKAFFKLENSMGSSYYQNIGTITLLVDSLINQLFCI